MQALVSKFRRQYWGDRCRPGRYQSKRAQIQLNQVPEITQGSSHQSTQKVASESLGWDDLTLHLFID